MSIFFTSDLHLGHRNAIKHCNRPFDSVEQMNNNLISNINNIVGLNDKLYILGDFTAYGVKRGDGIRFREQIVCKNVYLIYGNHDKDYQECHCFQGLYHYHEVKTDQGKVICFHYPIHVWNHKHHGSLHLHGHQHNKPEYNTQNKENGLLRYDVGVDANNYKPVSLEEIRKFFHGVKVENTKYEEF